MKQFYNVILLTCMVYFLLSYILFMIDQLLLHICFCIYIYVYVEPLFSWDQQLKLWGLTCDCR